ncbi:hypothetical protein QFZ29_002493 [Agromyces albus]|nr:hypothetical protein [Agromyces albus]
MIPPSFEVPFGRNAARRSRPDDPPRVRYDRQAVIFRGAIALAAIIIWLGWSPEGHQTSRPAM